MHATSCAKLRKASWGVAELARERMDPALGEQQSWKVAMGNKIRYTCVFHHIPENEN